jgi:hypothetical protein
MQSWRETIENAKYVSYWRRAPRLPRRLQPISVPEIGHCASSRKTADGNPVRGVMFRCGSADHREYGSTNIPFVPVDSVAATRLGVA